MSDSKDLKEKCFNVEHKILALKHTFKWET